MSNLTTSSDIGAKASSLILVGWREWCSLPMLHIPAIKAKIDTGAKTSALHAFDIKPYLRNRKQYVSFNLHPIQANQTCTRHCHARVIDERVVMSSNGQKEKRYVISTPIQLGEYEWNIELTLSNRDPLKFRLLLGREALKHNVIIDPARSLCQGKLTRKQINSIYKIK